MSLFFAWFVIHTIIILVDGLNDEVANVDVAVVLGNKVELDGVPSDRLKARLDKAIELFEDGYFPLILVSGGVGKEGYDEAEIMKDYLQQNDVPSEAILVDSDGYNSFRTAQNTKEIISDMNVESVLVISQYFHITRTKLAFRKLGFRHIYSAHADYVESRDIYSTIREFPAYYKYLLK
ncbi:YdcF family protein [Bacillus sp. YZJH907-2]|uniref:YdcF family protein n=2 Tax=Halalkalibacter suaedae TaxID=2822140 RepID=A0A940WS23_9BACI|nr:YdcF family protein [Bacillus suaedae]MBP3950738.1 YdcF family protein [Bacillus suaedae]